MAARGRKFSFMRLINNAVPNFAKDDILDVNLTPVQADKLVIYQLSLYHPLYLTPLSFYWAGMVEHKAISEKVHKALVKHDIISAPPSSSSPESVRKPSVTSSSANVSATLANAATTVGSETQSRWDTSVPTVKTQNITKNFANQLATISVHAQRKLVGMLFFWEEECTRWKLLNQEEAEILRAIDEHNEIGDVTGDGQTRNKDLEMALEAVNMKRKMLPVRGQKGRRMWRKEWALNYLLILSSSGVLVR